MDNSMVYTHSWQNCPIKLCFALMVFRSTKFDSPGSLAQLPSAPAYSTRAGASHPIHQRLPTRHEQEPAIRFTSAKKKKNQKRGATSAATLAFFSGRRLRPPLSPPATTHSFPSRRRCRLHAVVLSPGLYSDIGKKTRGPQHRFSLCSSLSFSVHVLVRWPIDTLLDPDDVMPG
jgi:hypothetical protein